MTIFDLRRGSARPATMSLVLASTSPRRRSLLHDAGYVFTVVAPHRDDPADAPAGVVAAEYTMLMADFKARQVASQFLSGLVLGADTMARAGDALVGKPHDARHARDMIASWRGRTHEVWSGVALIDAATGAVESFADCARVALGALSDDDLDAYIANGGWMGKAGGYNLAERIAAGWPIVCDGDPATVMGLPILELATRLAVRGVVPMARVERASA